MNPERLGDCRLVERIDEGPLTVVYRAVQEPLGRPVAVKALRGSIAPASPLAQRLLREASHLAPLRHAGVPALYGFVQSEAGMWLVLEPFEGVTLAALLARSPRGLEPAAAIALAFALGELLAYLHGRGLVHGDLRPEHVLVSPAGQIKLTEFGAVRVAGEVASSSEEAADFGLPHYLAPEQLLGEAPDPRSDLFSLGVLSFQVLTGARPFDAADPRGVTRRIRHDAPARLTSINPAVPPSLERIVERCLEKNADDRFPSAAALLEELARVQNELALPADASPLVQALARAGLGEPAPAPSPLAPSPRGAPAPARRAGVRRALVGQLVALGAMAFGASVIQANARERPGADEASATLELVPDRAAALRVVARPWATVYVDGQFVDVTPFAKAVPLRAGTHHVHFRHPAAPDVQRVVTLAPGATALVEVEMAVPPPPPPPPASAPAPTPADTTP